MLRQPITWRWHALLGVSSFLTLIAVYTYLSWQRQHVYPEDRMLPNWTQLYREGLLEVVPPRAWQEEWVPFFEPDTLGKGLAPVVQLIKVPNIPLLFDLKMSCYRFLCGLFVISALSIVMGLLMGCYAAAEAYFLPPLFFWSKIPGSALVGFMFIFFGLGTELFVAMMFFGVFPILAQNVYHAAKEDVPDELLYKARTLGASQLACIWDVICKHILPKLLEAIRLSLGPILVYLIFTEWLVGDVGMGCQMRLAFKKGAAGTPIMYVYAFVLGVLGLGIDTAFRRFQSWLCPWYGSEGDRL